MYLNDLKIYFIDYEAKDPLDELQHACDRVSSEHATISSLRGRGVCVLKALFHTSGILLKPTIYTSVALSDFLLSKISKYPTGSNESLSNLLFKSFTAPIGQLILACKAILGIIHPEFYFKKIELEKNENLLKNPFKQPLKNPLVNDTQPLSADESDNEISPDDPYFLEKGLNSYFIRLAKIAENVGCEAKLCDTLKKGTEIRISKKKEGESIKSYDVLFKRDLEIICKKLESSEFDSNEKRAIIEMFSDTDGLEASGIYACSPAFGRILEQICECINVPQDTQKIIPWLVAQYKIEVLNNIAMDKELCYDFFKAYISKDDIWKVEIHLPSLFIYNIGKKINLPLETIESCSKDSWNNYIIFSDDQTKKVLILFKEKYKEEKVLSYLQHKINSQTDGNQGLKVFRNYIIQMLTENISDAELEASKEILKNKFGVSEAFAKDPSFYVKFHYFLNPHLKPSEEAHFDLNISGIKKFMEIKKLIL